LSETAGDTYTVGLEGWTCPVKGLLIMTLYAGVAKVDITPPVGIAMSGYGERTSGAAGVHDPLFARVIVLTDGRVSLALVSTDLVWLYSEQLVTLAKEKWLLDHVVLCGTHTHSGPTDAPGPWHDSMQEKVIAAIGEAIGNLFPAHLSAASGDVDPACFGYNRRFVQPDGSVQMYWDNPQHIPNGPTDPTVRVIRIDDDMSKTRGVLVHHAAHPVVLGSGNVFISADFPGPMVQRIEQELGPDVMAMFFQGGGGDVHPYDSIMSGDAGFAAVARTGIALGNDVLRILKSNPPYETKRQSIRVQVQVLPMTYREDATRTADVGLMTVLLNGDIALAICSGEPFVQHQLDLVAKSPVHNTFLLGYAFFGIGIPLRTYLPSLQSTREGGYGAAVGSANILEVGAGEKLMDAAVSSLIEML
jgi:neutral ceramidase